MARTTARAAAATLLLLHLPPACLAAKDDAVAVIGGGIAGTTTVLSLLSRGYTNVTLYDSSPDLTSSTSSVIAGTINFDTPYRFLDANGLDISDAVDWLGGGFGFDGADSADMERFLNFAKNAQQERGGERNSDVQKRRVYRQSYEKMLGMIGRFPRLCTALVGDWCCGAGEEAAGYLQGATGITCPGSGGNGTDDAAGDDEDSPFGRFELLPEKCSEVEKAASNPISGCDDPAYSNRQSCEGAGHGYQDGVGYAYYDANGTLARVGDFVADGDGVRCSVACHALTGYVRTEVLFGEVLPEILRESPGVTVELGCLVAPPTLAVANGDESTATGQIALISTCGGADVGITAKVFDKVIVAASTASVPLLAAIDPALGTNLLGFAGHGVYGTAGDDGTPTISPEQTGRSVHFIKASADQKAAYARSMADGSIKIWGGLYPDPTDDDVRPPYAPPTDLVALDLFADDPAPEIAAAVYKASDGAVQTGVRPVPSVGNVPLIKRYEAASDGDGDWSNLYLNTGYGFNGYDLAWFSSDCVAEWLDEGKLTSAACRTAAAIGAEKEDDFPIWAIVVIALGGTLALAGCCCFCVRRRRARAGEQERAVAESDLKENEESENLEQSTASASAQDKMEDEN